ncbi:hypothetical protein [Flavobacterium pectinovorum]|uniref:hypothetical protein n=1 Tax=Flavobacterium pectinovorum TaxID=29533 RepID=UPI001FAE6998|nr:hypothetical protein [Flavobacterium pectinovorum]MCI9843379.1 hypothetical protein [Flavobacterium pectinovorum]
MKKIFLTLSLMTAMFFVSCDQNSADDEVQGSTLSAQATLNSQAKLASNALTEELCVSVSDSAVVNKVTAGSSGNYCFWGQTTKSIGAVSVQFEGMYGSGIRPLTPGWYIGVVDPSYACEDGWDTIASEIAVKNDTISDYVGNAPTCTPVIVPQNVVGAIGSVGTYDFKLGYYTYASTAFNITKKIVIWKDPSATSATAITDPVNATEAYLVEVTNIVPTFTSSPFYGTVSYTYTKIK